MVASKIQKVGRRRGRILKSGIKSVMVASKIKKYAAAAAECRILSFGS